MKTHTPRRSWWRLGIWRCSCGRRAWHPMQPRPAGAPIPDGNTIPFAGYPTTTDVLARSHNQRRWP
jgi:hypothetical protein